MRKVLEGAAELVRLVSIGWFALIALFFGQLAFGLSSVSASSISPLEQTTLFRTVAGLAAGVAVLAIAVIAPGSKLGVRGWRSRVEAVLKWSALGGNFIVFTMALAVRSDQQFAFMFPGVFYLGLGVMFIAFSLLTIPLRREYEADDRDVLEARIRQEREELALAMAAERELLLAEIRKLSSAQAGGSLGRLRSLLMRRNPNAEYRP